MRAQHGKVALRFLLHFTAFLTSSEKIIVTKAACIAVVTFCSFCTAFLTPPEEARQCECSMER